jgi:uncharacterized membrane protein YdjX (TVP38/TMEM64 family)
VRYRADMLGGRGAIRLAIVAIAAAALIVVAFTTDIRTRFTIDHLQTLTTACGAWGIVAYGAMFCVGLLLYVPGMVFYAVAVLAWGPALGGTIAFVGALIAVTASFAIVRAIGGQPLAKPQRPWVRRTLGQLDRRPITTVFLLRLVFWTSPPFNYGFALSSVGFRDHLIGTTFGLVPGVIAMAVFTKPVIDLLGL